MFDKDASLCCARPFSSTAAPNSGATETPRGRAASGAPRFPPGSWLSPSAWCCSSRSASSRRWSWEQRRWEPAAAWRETWGRRSLTPSSPCTSCWSRRRGASPGRSAPYPEFSSCWSSAPVRPAAAAAPLSWQLIRTGRHEMCFMCFGLLTITQFNINKHDYLWKLWPRWRFKKLHICVNGETEIFTMTKKMLICPDSCFNMIYNQYYLLFYWLYLQIRYLKVVQSKNELPDAMFES